MSNQTDNKKLIRRYINDMQNHLPFLCPGRCKLISNIEEELQNVLTDNKIDDYDTLCSLVGSPLYVCDNYLNNLSYQQLKRTKLIGATVVVFLLIALITGFVCMQKYYEKHPVDNGYLRVYTIVSEPEVVDESEDNSK